MNYCLTYYTCALSSSHLTLFFFLSSSSPPFLFFSHAPSFFPYTLHIPDLTPLPTRRHPRSPVLSFTLVMCHSPPSHRVSLFSLCPPISWLSAPLCLAHYFCSIVHSVWGWTRTPPWPPVRGERLSGTKTSIAPPFFSPSSYPVIDGNSNSTNNMTLKHLVRSYKVQFSFFFLLLSFFLGRKDFLGDSEVDQTKVSVSLMWLQMKRTKW